MTTEYAALVEKRNEILERSQKILDTASAAGRDLEDREAEVVKLFTQRAAHLRSEIERLGNTSRGRRTSPTNPSEARAMNETSTTTSDTIDLQNETRQQREERRYRAGQWVVGHLLGDKRAAAWCDEHGVGEQRNSLWTGDNTKGGVLVPDELAREIIWNRDQRGVFRADARVINLSSDNLTLPVLTTPPTATFLNSEQDGVFGEDEPSYGSIEITPKEVGLLTRVSRALTEDSVVDLAGHLAEVSGWAFADLEDGCAFIGNGTSTFGGMEGLFVKLAKAAHAASVVTATGRTSFGALTLPDFVNMVTTLPQWAHSGAAWYISPSAYGASILRLITALSGNSKRDVTGGDSMQFLGFPVRLSSKLNSDLTAQSGELGCVLANLRLCGILGDRRRLGMQVLRERFAEKSQIGFLSTQRFHAVTHALGTADEAGAAIALKFG